MEPVDYPEGGITRGVWNISDGGEGFTHIWFQDAHNYGGMSPVNIDLEPQDMADLAQLVATATGLLCVSRERLRAAAYDAAMARHAGCDGPASCGCGLCGVIAEAAAEDLLARLTAPEPAS